MTKNLTEKIGGVIEEIFASAHPGNKEVARIALLALFTEEENRRLEAIEVAITACQVKEPRCYCREYSMGEHNCEQTSNDTIRDILELLRSTKNEGV